MPGPLSKDTLLTRAKQLAYTITSNEHEWENVQLPPDILKQVEQMRAAHPDDPNIEITETDEHGNEIPATEETLTYLREDRSNLAGSKYCTIPVPEGWSDDEVKLATLLLEGAMFKMGMTPYMFNKPDAGALFSCDLMYQENEPDHKLIRAATNVIGHVESLTYQEIASKIDETMDDLEKGWKVSMGSGKLRYGKHVDIKGDFPFLFEWMQSYAAAANQQTLLKPTIGYDMCDTHDLEENRRFAILLHAYELPPIVKLEMDIPLLKTMKDNGFAIGTTREITR
jgi:hypothetical protein